jgi:AraC family transcriptional regulator
MSGHPKALENPQIAPATAEADVSRQAPRTSVHSSVYLERINRAIDYVVSNLAQPLRLEDVARAAYVSPFHFHRIFKAVLGETLGQFVKRLRLERALYLMSHAPRRTLTEVALDCGFASSIDFSRSFKQYYGAAPRTFDLQGFRDAKREQFEQTPRRYSTANSEQDGESLSPRSENLTRHNRITSLPPGQNPDAFSVTLRDLPARSVAYIRVFDPYREGVVQAAYDKLLTWAIARGLAQCQWLGYMWDEPEIVALANCRYDAALVVSAVSAEGEIGRFDFPPMRVAEVVVRGDIALETRAIDWLYTTWLPHSGYIPDDHPAFEAWIGLAYAHGNAHFELAFQLPVKRA